MDDNVYRLKPPPKLKIIENAENETIIINKNYPTYRGYVFLNCKNCNIIFSVKTLKIMFVDVHHSNIYIQHHVIGMTEMLRCKDIKVHINAEITIIQQEFCTDTNIYHTTQDTSKEIKYVCSFSINLNTYVNGLLFELPCNFLTAQVYITIAEGIMYFNYQPYILNNITAHISEK